MLGDLYVDRILGNAYFLGEFKYSRFSEFCEYREANGVVAFVNSG
jgi:hypothetical protein